MGISELAQTFASHPLAAIAALEAVAICALFFALIRSYSRRINAAETYSYDLARMLDLHSRTLDVLGRVYAVLELPAVHKLLNGSGRRHRGNE